MGHALPLRTQFFSLYYVGWNLVTRLNEREVEVQLAITVLFASPDFFFSVCYVSFIVMLKIGHLCHERALCHVYYMSLGAFT